MMLDYLVIPIINTIYGALTLARLFPGVPYIVWAAIIAALITYLNLRGIRSTARSNIVLLVVMCVVIAAFLILAVHYLVHVGGVKALFSIHPFYDPGTTDFSSIATATSLAALTYIGFDGVTTLSEEVHDPKRNILRATVLVCFLTGVFSGIQVYLAQLVWPDFTTFPNLETAFMDVSKRVGGVALFNGMAFILIVASVGSGLSGEAGAARLLFGMGRDNALPRKLFAHIDPKYRSNLQHLDDWIDCVFGCDVSQLGEGRRSLKLRRFPRLYGSESRHRQTLLFASRPKRQKTSRKGLAVACFRLPLLPLDLVEPAPSREDCGWSLVCRRLDLQWHHDARISKDALHDRFQ